MRISTCSSSGRTCRRSRSANSWNQTPNNSLDHSSLGASGAISLMPENMAAFTPSFPSLENSSQASKATALADTPLGFSSPLDHRRQVRSSTHLGFHVFSPRLAPNLEKILNRRGSLMVPVCRKGPCWLAGNSGRERTQPDPPGEGINSIPQPATGQVSLILPPFQARLMRRTYSDERHGKTPRAFDRQDPTGRRIAGSRTWRSGIASRSPPGGRSASTRQP